MRLTDYCAHVDALCSSHRFRRYRELFHRFPELDLDQRSSVTKLCRAQCYPHRSTRLARLTNNLPTTFRRELLPLCQTPLLAGLVLQLVLLAPMSQREVERIFTESLIKEMVLMESVRRACSLNFEAFFGYYDIQVHPSVPVNRTIASTIHRGIDAWIASLEKRLLYPRIGSKTVSKRTEYELRCVDPTYVLNDVIGVTPIDLERVYHRYGVRISGPCELRQKWYYSILQPRTYFAQGGDAYHTSKYLADPTTDLCDTLPATNRRTRVDPSRLTIRRLSDDVAYYDLTSFTSNLHVQCVFMYRLAKYCEGHTVRILDSFYGVLECDLGALIRDYTSTNLDNPSYTIPSKYGDPSVVHYHSIAGFLGVYGNISTATFIHGIVMAMRHDYLDENNVAGDDGLDITADVSATLELVGSLGIIKDEKTFRDSEGCCIHLKRPISRTGDRLLHGQLVTWPSLEPVQKDSDARYPYLRRLTNRERRDTLASSITAFLRKLEYQTLDNDALDLVDAFLSNLYDTYDLPRAGCVPQITQEASGFVPAYERRYIGTDPIANTIGRNYANIAKLPLRGKLDWDPSVLGERSFECNGNKLLKHLVVLGYVDQEKVSCYVFGIDGMQQLLKEYTNPDPTVYRYTRLRELPVWINEVLSNS